jgi:ribose 5-phosphate isomerase B
VRSVDDIRALVARVVDEVMAATPAATAAAPAADAVTVAIGSDHGGFELKQVLVPYLEGLGCVVHDCGWHTAEAVDYPDVAHAVALKVARDECRWGIIVDGAGIGSAMVANKVPGIRAAQCYDVSTARNSREHNHANVLTLGGGLVGPGLARQIVEVWLATPWGGDRHARRVAKISALDERYRKGDISR